MCVVCVCVCCVYVLCVCVVCIFGSIAQNNLMDQRVASQAACAPPLCPMTQWAREVGAIPLLLTPIQVCV